jgi:hypothetical protein
MWQALVALIVVLVAFFVFGVAGLMLGQRIESRSAGTNIAPAFFIIFGFGGMCLVVWLMSVIFGGM